MMPKKLVFALILLLFFSVSVVPVLSLSLGDVSRNFSSFFARLGSLLSKILKNSSSTSYTNCQEKYGQSFWCATWQEWQAECRSQGVIHEDSPGCDTNGKGYGYCVRCGQ